MKIVFASDHAGFKLKNVLVEHARALGYETEDLGPAEYDETDDYPDFISRAAEVVSNNPKDTRAVVLGGSGQGEAMVANRFSAVRAAVYYGGDPEIIRRSRKDNDANILSLAARFISEDEAKEALLAWLQTDFPGEERHSRRIKKIDTYPSDNLG